MEMVKPEPLVIDGRPYYTLTSYEPVTVEVDVHDITEEDVEQAMAFAIAQNGGGPDRLNDDAWIRDKFEGMHGAAELKSTIRSEMEAANQEMMEGQVAVACASELAKRLVQRVTAEQVAAIRQDIEQSFEATLAEQGATIDLVLAQTGGSKRLGPKDGSDCKRRRASANDRRPRPRRPRGEAARNGHTVQGHAHDNGRVLVHVYPRRREAKRPSAPKAGLGRYPRASAALSSNVLPHT